MSADDTTPGEAGALPRRPTVARPHRVAPGQLGRAPLLRLPRRRHQRPHLRAATHRRPRPVRPGPPRGDRRVRRLGARQVRRRAAGLRAGDQRPGRDPPAQRPVRRQARPPAGGRPGRAHRADRRGRRLLPGGRPARPLQGRRGGVPGPARPPDPGTPPGRPGVPHGAGPAHRHRLVLPARHPGRAGRAEPAARARLLPHQQRAEQHADGAAGGGPAPRPPRCCAAGERVAMLVGQGALGARGRGPRDRRRLGAGVATALLGFTAVDHRSRG